MHLEMRSADTPRWAAIIIASYVRPVMFCQFFFYILQKDKIRSEYSSILVVAVFILAHMLIRLELLRVFNASPCAYTTMGVLTLLAVISAQRE